MKGHRLLTTVIALVLPVLLLSGCWHDNTTQQSEELQEIEASVNSSEEEAEDITLPAAFSLAYYPAQPLDPVTCPDGTQQILVTLLYEGLYELDQRFTPQPKLCSDASYDAAALTWTFTLRSGVTFSDGSPLTAADVAATLKRAMGSTRYGSRLSGIKGVAAGSGVVTVTLHKANANLPALLDIPIVKSGTEGNPVPLGTGPYVFISDESGIYLSTNKAWWNGDGQPVNRIGLVSCGDEDSMLYKFSSHDVQLITGDVTGSTPVSVTGNISFYDADTTILQYVGLNMRRNIFSSAALRSALNQGIDRTTLVSAYLSGHGQPAQFPVPPSSTRYPADLEKAYDYTNYETAMTAAGYNTGATHTLTMIVNGENSFKVSIAKRVASYLSVFDLNVQVRVLSWEDYQKALSSGNYDLYYGEVKLTADGNIAPLVGTGGSLNYGGFSDVALDDLLSQYSASGSSEAMKALGSYLQTQAPILPVCFKSTSVLSQEGVVGNLTPTAADPFYDLTTCTINLAG